MRYSGSFQNHAALRNAAWPVSLRLGIRPYSGRNLTARLVGTRWGGGTGIRGGHFALEPGKRCQTVKISARHITDHFYTILERFRVQFRPVRLSIPFASREQAFASRKLNFKRRRWDCRRMRATRVDKKIMVRRGFWFSTRWYQWRSRSVA